MNKNELIEKAVIDLGGDFDAPQFPMCYAFTWLDGATGRSMLKKIPEHIEICNREEFDAATDRMRGKPDWSEVLSKHPDAQYLAQWPGDTGGGTGANVGLWISYDRMPECEGGYLVDEAHEVFHHNKGSLIGDWRNTLEKRPEQSNSLESDRYGIVPPVNKNEGCSISAPDKPWFEVGELPPVGVEVEAKNKNAQPDWTQPGFYKTTPVFFGNSIVIFRDKHGHETVGSHDDYLFRPINPDRQQLIDIIESVGNQSNGVLADAILAAGWGWLGK